MDRSLLMKSFVYEKRRTDFVKKKLFVDKNVFIVIGKETSKADFERQHKSLDLEIHCCV